jgi:hypothetical protein
MKFLTCFNNNKEEYLMNKLTRVSIQRGKNTQKKNNTNIEKREMNYTEARKI